MRYAGTMPVACDDCGVTITVDDDVPDTELLRLGWWSPDGVVDKCPQCKPGTLREFLVSTLLPNHPGASDERIKRAIIRLQSEAACEGRQFCAECDDELTEQAVRRRGMLFCDIGCAVSSWNPACEETEK